MKIGRSPRPVRIGLRDVDKESAGSDQGGVDTPCDAAVVVLLCGLPASGKTTIAARLAAGLDAVLIRSCDVYQRLGISLPGWVIATRGMTQNVEGYERLRDRAYEEMARELRAALADGARAVVVDAVHGERDKRAAVFALCQRYRAVPVLVWCRCDDLAETDRRLAARCGREAEPEHEASDMAVYRHIVSLWNDPLADDAMVDVAVCDTKRGITWWERCRDAPQVELVARVLREVGEDVVSRGGTEPPTPD